MNKIYLKYTRTKKALSKNAGGFLGNVSKNSHLMHFLYIYILVHDRKNSFVKETKKGEQK